MWVGSFATQFSCRFFDMKLAGIFSTMILSMIRFAEMKCKKRRGSKLIVLNFHGFTAMPKRFVITMSEYQFVSIALCNFPSASLNLSDSISEMLADKNLDGLSTWQCRRSNVIYILEMQYRRTRWNHRIQSFVGSTAPHFEDTFAFFAFILFHVKTKLTWK